MSRTIGLLAGLTFGVLLALARMNEYDAIHDMLLLRSAEFYLVFAAAAPTSMAGLWLLRRAGWRTALGGPLQLNRYPVSRKDVVGAAIFWAVVGACSGPRWLCSVAATWLAVVVVTGIFCGMLLRDIVVLRRAAGTPMLAR